MIVYFNIQQELYIPPQGMHEEVPFGHNIKNTMRGVLS